MSSSNPFHLKHTFQSPVCDCGGHQIWTSDRVAQRAVLTGNRDQEGSWVGFNGNGLTMFHCNSGLVQSGFCWYKTYIKYGCLAVVVPMMASNCRLGDFWGWGSLLSIEATNYKWSTDCVDQALRFCGLCCSGSSIKNWALCKLNFEPNSINWQKKWKLAMGKL